MCLRKTAYAVKVVDKSLFITGLQDSVDAQLQRAVQLLRLNDELLNRPSTTGGWSINQCFAHLVSYGDYYLPVLKNALRQQTDRNQESTFAGSWLGSYLTRIMNPQTGRTKFNAAKRHQPAVTRESRESVEAFIGQQYALQELLSLAKNANVSSVRVPLSIARWIRLPVGDILQFMVTHIERHVQQAERNV